MSRRETPGGALWPSLYRLRRQKKLCRNVLLSTEKDESLYYQSPWWDIFIPVELISLAWAVNVVQGTCVWVYLPESSFTASVSLQGSWSSFSLCQSHMQTQKKGFNQAEDTLTLRGKIRHTLQSSSSTQEGSTLLCSFNFLPFSHLLAHDANMCHADI